MSALVVLLLATALLGCQDNMMETTRFTPCATVGQQCDLGNGVLGVLRCSMCSRPFATVLYLCQATLVCDWDGAP